VPSTPAAPTPAAATAAVQARPASAFRNPDFRKLWSAATISLLGTQISQIAIPAIAVLLLHAAPFQVALLGTIEFLPFLLFTLPAGVWVDRLSRRRILISGDVGRALMLATIPIAWFGGVLTIWQLYLVGFVNGLFTVFFDIADQSYLPTVLEREQLVDGNAKLQASGSIAQVIGQPLGGGVIGLLTAPLAVALDAASYVVSALLVFAIRRRERASPARPSAAASAEATVGAPAAGASVAAEVSVDSDAAEADLARPGIRQEVAEGLRFVLGHRYLRNIAATTGLSNLFSNIVFSIYPVYAYVNLGLTPALVGLAGGGFGLGAFLGAVTANRVAARIGVGPAIVASIALGGPAALLVAVATPETAVFLLALSGFVGGWATVVYNVNQVSLRQAITPEPLLGRMNATMRFLVWGTIPIGQIIGGAIATVLNSVHVAIWIGAIGGLVAFVPVFFSPVRTLQRIPDAEPTTAPD
jgi:MFS family permease